MISRIAIIPARGGSKRIPNKNIRDFCGKPMIAHILEVARVSGLFDMIHVSTESQNICTVVEELGFCVDFLRPAELADDQTQIMPVLKYVINTYATKGRVFDQVWLLMACAPFVRSNDLQQAAVMFDRDGGHNSLLAVTEYPVPIEWAFTRSEDGILTYVQEGMFAVRSQDLEKKYYDNGSFAIFPSETAINSRGATSNSRFVGYVLPKGTIIDIDDEEDWTFAEAMYRMRQI